MGKVIRLQGTKEFPDLDALMGYFHQDSDIYGDTLEDVVGAFRKGAEGYPRRAQRVQSDIGRFVAARPNDQQLDSDLETFFSPGTLVDTWEPEISTWRQWLTRVSEILHMQHSEATKSRNSD